MNVRRATAIRDGFDSSEAIAPVTCRRGDPIPLKVWVEFTERRSTVSDVVIPAIVVDLPDFHLCLFDGHPIGIHDTAIYMRDIAGRVPILPVDSDQIVVDVQRQRLG